MIPAVADNRRAKSEFWPHFNAEQYRDKKTSVMTFSYGRTIPSFLDGKAVHV
jgi:hypothetical protein